MGSQPTSSKAQVDPPLSSATEWYRTKVAALALLLLAAAGGQAALAWVPQIPGIIGDSPLREGLVQGFLLIFFSEIGDKTFFIALILAARSSKAGVFAGTFGALAIMTVISVSIGTVLHELDALLPEALRAVPVDDLVAVGLLTWFGIQTLRGADEAKEDAAEEREEALKTVDGRDAQEALVPLILSTFVLVFAAEWGDKSFIATIALAAASNPLGVTLGAVGGHGAATVIAVLGGSFLSQYLSERAIRIAGGSLFLVFAVSTLVDLFF